MTKESNPFLESLPPIRNINQVYESLLKDKVFEISDRQLPNEEKLHLLHKLKDVYLPTSRILDLEKRISLLIRTGYLERNPHDKREYELLFHEGILYNKGYKYSESLSLIGIPGVGKSKAIEKILSNYPQVIFHENPINRFQIPWLKIDCAHDSSLKTLCMTFFSEIDLLLGTNYLKDYGSKLFSTSAMVLNMKHLARLHAIGVLVIDEIQYLLSGRGVNYEQVMNFFVSLSNSVGVPILLVGTMKAKKVLQRDFRQARRSCGLGDMVWENFQPDDVEWKALVETLWNNQLLEEIPSLSEEILNVLYEETQGIVDILVKLISLTQMRALDLGFKKIDGHLIKKVSKEDLQIVKPMIKAIKSKNPKEIIKYEDLVPMNFERSTDQGRSSEAIKEKRVKSEKGGSLSKQAFYYLKDMGVKHHKIDILIENAIEEFAKDNVPDIVFKVLDLINSEEMDSKTTKHVNPGVIDKVIEMKKDKKSKDEIHNFLKDINFVKEISNE